MGTPALGRETNWKPGQLALFKHFYTHLYLEKKQIKNRQTYLMTMCLCNSVPQLESTNFTRFR